MATGVVSAMELRSSFLASRKRNLSSSSLVKHVQSDSFTLKSVKETCRVEAAGSSRDGEYKDASKLRVGCNLNKLIKPTSGKTGGSGFGNSQPVHLEGLSVRRPKLITPTRTHAVMQKQDGNRIEGLLNSLLEQVWSSKDVPSAICNAAEGLITLMEPAQRPHSADPAKQLSDNFAPVVEEYAPSGFCLEIEGSLPTALNGVYVRNGSNPQFMPTGGYHQFDGDGMLHAVRIHDGRASYCCRYTRTDRFLEEARAGRAIMPRAMGELFGLTGVARLGLFGLRKALGVISRQGAGAANAGLAFHNGRLLAMSEDDMPYAVRISPEDGDILTLGRLDFNGDLSHPMTAHPKVDPITGELFAYGYDLLTQPFLKYFRVSSEGQMSTTVGINMKEPTIMHDFVVTERYAVFPEPKLVFSIDRMMNGYNSAIFLDKDKIPKFGVLPKYDTDVSRMKWFDMPGPTCTFHFTNGWDEGEDEVVLVGAALLSPLDTMFNDPGNLRIRPTEYRLNLKTGQSSRRELSDEICDFGGINNRFAGRKNRYTYLTTPGPWPKISGVVKIDFSPSDQKTSMVGKHLYPPGCYGSEPFFVPRSEDPTIEEDDGYVLSYVHNETTGTSELLVMDARSPTLQKVASIKLPARVPYGFHGIFLDEQQLARQNTEPM